jgi:hypothetical protein
LAGFGLELAVLCTLFGLVFDGIGLYSALYTVHTHNRADLVSKKDPMTAYLEAKDWIERHNGRLDEKGRLMLIMELHQKMLD